MRRLLYPSLRHPRLYLKEFPLHLNPKALHRVKTVGKFLGISLLTAFITYVLLNNFAPWGITMHYILSEDHTNISTPGPEKRVVTEVQNGQEIYHLKNNLIYFTTKMPFAFEKATVRIVFKNPNRDQTFSVGFKDEAVWHYNTKAFDIPFFNTLSWTKQSSNLSLYQREYHFDSTDAFLDNPPKQALIGTYGYDFDLIHDATVIKDYKPATQNTIIDTPLRGKHTLYVYLKKEPFFFTIEKQDLNWYEDPDPMTIKIYKEKDMVYEFSGDDDGIQDSSAKIIPPQELTIKNPGPDLPEDGIYKVVIDASDDTIIKKITTNLHKIVFAGSIFPVANSNAYKGIVSSTSATTVYTNALLLSATTHHNAGLQNIIVGDKELPLSGVKATNTITPEETITKVVVPKNDIVLTGFQGYFAFNQNQFFQPTSYRTLPVTNKEDVALVDYILADYVPSKTTGDWQVAERTFDIRSAFIKNGQLSWVMQLPKLKENKRDFLIQDIAITFKKQPWF